MIIESIILVIFICSLGGVLFILARKISVLNTLPQTGTTGIKKHQIILDVEHKIKEVLIYFEKQILLHKLLSLIKVITLKIETRVDVMLQGVRKKAQRVDREIKEKKAKLPK